MSFALRTHSSSCSKLPQRVQRTFSSAGDILVQQETRRVGSCKVAVLKLSNPPVNSFKLPLLTELNTCLEALNSSSSIKGVIISSSLPVFSAGIDFNELSQPDPIRLKTFWCAFQSLWKHLYSSHLVTVAAINGHCLAGGTLLATSCDHRVAQHGAYNVSVPTAKVGVPAPFWFQKMLVGLMGQRRTELTLQQGKSYSLSEAVDIGLVDELYRGDNLVQHCLEKVFPPYLNVFEEARIKMKQSLHSDLVQEFERRREEEAEEFVNYIMQSSVQHHLQQYKNKMKRQVSN